MIFFFSCRISFLFNWILLVLFSKLWSGEWPLIMLQSFRPAGIPGFRSGPTSQPGRPWPAPGVLPVPLWQRLWPLTEVLVSKLFHCWRTVSWNGHWETLVLYQVHFIQLVLCVTVSLCSIVFTSHFRHGEDLIVTPFAQVRADYKSINLLQSLHDDILPGSIFWQAQFSPRGI